MTILDGKMNSSAKNFDFSKKKEIYKKTELSLTNEMSVQDFIMNEDYIIKRHKKITDLLIESFDF